MIIPLPSYSFKRKVLCGIDDIFQTVIYSHVGHLKPSIKESTIEPTKRITFEILQAFAVQNPKVESGALALVIGFKANKKLTMFLWP